MSRRRPRGWTAPLVGLALAPTGAFALEAALSALGRLGQGGGFALPFLAGLVGFPVLLLARLRFSRSYVLGHELTHALAAWASGVRVHRLKVGREGGHVVLSRSTAFIALAPYFIPLYALLWLGLARLAGLWGPVPGWALQGGLGAALSFHFVLTARTLWEEHQTDLDAAGGPLFSLSVILLANSLVLLGAVKGLYPSAFSLGEALTGIALGTAGFWAGAGELLADGASRLAGPS